MSNANRDYAIVYDVKNSSLVLSRPLSFYITDKNTSNIFVRLVTRVNAGNGIDQYTSIEEASNYVLTMRVIKPNNEVKNLEATQHEPKSIFQFDLTEDFKDMPGKYICELTISTMVNSRQELITSDPFSYEVKRSILSNVGEIIETEDTTVEKLLNNLDATKAELSSQIKEIAEKGTTVEAIKNATKEEIDKQIADGIIANLTIENCSITEDKMGKNLANIIKDKNALEYYNYSFTNDDFLVNTFNFEFINGEFNYTAPTSYEWALIDIEELSTFVFKPAKSNYWMPVSANDTNCLAVSLKTGEIRKFNRDGSNKVLYKPNLSISLHSNIVLRFEKFGAIYRMYDNDTNALLNTIDFSDYEKFSELKLGVLITPSNPYKPYKLYEVKSYKNEIIFKNLKNKVDNIAINIGSDKVVDLVINMGQSNASGRGVASESIVCPSGHGYEFKSVTDPTRLYDIVEPFGSGQNNDAVFDGVDGATDLRTGSYVSALAKTFYEIEKVPQVFVSCTKGDTSSTTWLTGKTYHNEAIRRFQLAENWLLDNGYIIRYKYMIWCQGEADGSESLGNSTRTTQMKNIIEGMMSACDIEKCFMIRIGNRNETGKEKLYTNIIKYDTNLCKVYKNIVLVSTKAAGFATEGKMKDTAHWTQQGYNEVGIEAGTNIAFYLKNKKEPFMYDPEYNDLYVSKKY